MYYQTNVGVTMEPLNGEQLYGLKRLWATLKMGMNRELKGLSLKQKLALNCVSRESKLTRLGDKIFTNGPNLGAGRIKFLYLKFGKFHASSESNYSTL